MGNAGGELPQRGHLFCLHELHLGLLEGLGTAFDLVAQALVVAVEHVPGGLGLQLHLDPGIDDGGTDGLVDVVGRPQAKTALLAVLVDQGRHQDHRDVPGSGLFTQALEHFEAIHVRHHDVEQDQIRPRLARSHLKGLDATGCRDDPQVAGQHPLQHHPIDGFVVHHQNGVPVGPGVIGAAVRMIHDEIPLLQQSKLI